MFRKSVFGKFFAALALGCLAATPVLGANLKILPGHVPSVISLLQPLADLPATNVLRLAIGLPLRDPAGLSNFLEDIYNPASPNFRKFLTPADFTARFGPTEQDYAAVKNFAVANGFQITDTHDNRLLLDVQARVDDIQRAFQVRLRKYLRPNGQRDFFAPDSDPMVDVSLPISDISGLNDYVRPHPKLLKKRTVSGQAVSRDGSAPDGSLLGDDFRNAYVPGVTLTGSGQQIGVLEFDNYYPADVTDYANLAGGGRSSIPIQTVLIGGYDGTPTSDGNGEVALDIQMAMSMAPGLADIVVFSAGPNGFQNDILSSMADSNGVESLACCWGWSGGPSTTTDALFQKLAAQGQSFFDAAGDGDAFTSGANSVNPVDKSSLANAPASDPYITQVGGTTLMVNGRGGSWESETVWNWGDTDSSLDGEGTSGGISTYYAIPTWQAGVSMASNKGSATKRNIPDVAMVADNVYSYSDNGQAGPTGGTSCAAPLWAGLTALANEQATALGKPALGLINRAVYAIGASASYGDCFNDITTGDNTWSSSPNAFFAVSGYDLCTGWGTPKGNALINALLGEGNNLVISSTTSFSASGVLGGPFNSPAPVITLTNSGPVSLNWSLLHTNVATWLNASPASGALQPDASATVSLNFTAAAAKLAVGKYQANLDFDNLTSVTTQVVPFHLQVLPALSVESTNVQDTVGAAGGPFSPAVQEFSVNNLGATSAVWQVSVSANWLAASQKTGTVAAASSEDFDIFVTTNANRLKAGTYKATVTVENQKKQSIGKLPFLLSIGQNIVSNGGFETGNFIGWDVNAGNSEIVRGKSFAHSGKYGAQLGQALTLGQLSQTVPTIAGQTYLLSLWFRNPLNTYGATPNEFLVQWEGATLFDQTDLPFNNWTNLQFSVTAANSGSLLNFGFRDDPYFLSLDDVSLKPVTVPHLLKIITRPAAFTFTFQTVPGSIYQAQCKTNLAQPDWINLGDAVTATNNELMVTDPGVTGFPQKFYRLMVVGP